MHIVILGAGALGTVLGAHLARAGEEVTLIARGIRAAYLQEQGATLTGLVDFTVPVHVVTDPSQVHDADVLIVTVKTYDMEAALQSIKHLRAASVLSLQNGVLKYQQLAQTFGWAKVLGAMTTLGAEVLPTGTVRVTANQGFYLGTGADLGGHLRSCRDRSAGDAIDAGVGMVKMRDLRVSHGSCSPDAFGDLQVLARGTDGIPDGRDGARDGAARHRTGYCTRGYGVFPHQDPESIGGGRHGYARAAARSPMGVAATHP